MTKTQHAQYLQSPHWKSTRLEAIENADNKCEQCQIPRWLAKIAYDQDLNVHHLSYANKGREEPEDLQALCRRCHEIEKFGRSDLREPKSTHCEVCSTKHWDYYSNRCDLCKIVTEPTSALRLIYSLDNKVDRCGGMKVLDFITMISMIHNEGLEPMLETMRRLEPLVKSSMAKTNSSEYIDIPF